MPSSTSSSEHAPPSPGAHYASGARRPVASDELPSADWVAREIPPFPRWLLLVAALVALAGTLAWEVAMRGIGLTTADLGDTPGHWAVERRKLDRGEADVVIVGDSRILFDTDLALLEAMTGQRVVQLSVVGTNSLFLLEHVVQQTDFSGVVLVGLAESSFFRPLAGGAGYAARQMAYFETESPSQRAGHQLQLMLSRVFAFIDEGHRLSKLLEMFHLPRRHVRSPYDSPWKVFESRERRQTLMWREIWENPWRLAQARRAWNDFKGEPAKDEVVAATIARAKVAVDTIRARGGDVVFLRPPSSDPVLANEIARFPRARVWDRLVAETATVGLHFADDASLSAMDLPEYSHLSPPCARHYTYAYATALRERVPRLSRSPVDLEALRPREACVRRVYEAAPAPPFPELPGPRPAPRPSA
ncbi:MAG TPA: hypothetical protein VFO79_09770 [Xanthomonadales bacterium]|nr:hypothetical protein [Xanthomonadales bacterium]